MRRPGGYSEWDEEMMERSHMQAERERRLLASLASRGYPDPYARGRQYDPYPAPQYQPQHDPGEREYEDMNVRFANRQPHPHAYGSFSPTRHVDVPPPASARPNEGVRRSTPTQTHEVSDVRNHG